MMMLRGQRTSLAAGTDSATALSTRTPFRRRAVASSRLQAVASPSPQDPCSSIADSTSTSSTSTSGTSTSDAVLGRRSTIGAGVLLLTLADAARLAAGAAAAAAAEPDHAGAAAPSLHAIKTVFVAGATGRTGRRVVQQLRAANYFDRRKAEGLGFGFDKGVTLVEADVTQDASTLAAAIGDAQAVICATGATGFGAASAASVDEQGTVHLIDAARQAGGVTTFVLLTSLLTNARAVGQAGNADFRLLNLFGGVLDHKLAAELYLSGSGLRWTIVRPGGLSDKPADEVGQLVTAREDSLFALDTDPGRAISRDTVAEVLVAALRQPGAANRVVEVVASPSAPRLPEDRWYDV